MASLTLLDGGKLEPVDVAAVDAAVLTRAVVDMQAWIDDLPTESEWRWSFIMARRGLVDALRELEDEEP